MYEIFDSLVWLDKKFVESILRRVENNADLSVLDIDVRSAVPKGDNYASLLVRVTADYITNQQNDHKLPAIKKTLIVKTLPLGETLQAFVKLVRYFTKESHIYEITLPKIYKLFKERTGVKQEHLATNIFTCDRPDTIVLEDLRPLGYKMADRRQGLDLEHSMKAIKILAKFHVSSLILHAEDPTTMDVYTESLYVEETRKIHGEFLENTYKSLATEIEAWSGFESYAEKIRSQAPLAVDRILEMMQNKAGAMRVLNHGDFWTNNMLFRYEDGIVADVKMLDFQMVRFASPALDILYFLHTSPNQDVLEDFWDQLITEYHESFTETLSSLGDDRVVTLEDINRELADKAYYAVVISCLLCIMVVEPEDAPDLSIITEENMATVGADSFNKTYSGKRFRSVFERRLPRFAAKGLI